MNKFIVLFFLIIFLEFPAVLSQNIRIYGNAASYTGEQLELFKLDDYITKSKKIISRSTVDSEGNFSFDFTETDTIPVFINLDVFEGILFIEPGQSYKIILPKKTVKNESDRLNPYFRPIEFYIRTLNNTNNLSTAIKHFDNLYNKSVKYIFEEKKNSNFSLTDKEITKLRDSASLYNDYFFNNYVNYSLLQFRYLSFYNNKNEIIRTNFAKQPVLYQNPAYNKFLNESFSTFIFDTFSKKIYDYLSSDYSWNAYMNLLQTDEIFINKEFREYLLILNLAALFYQNPIYQKNIINLLISSEKSDLEKRNKEIISTFLNNSSQMIIGYQVPGFNLYDKDSKKHSIKDFGNSFVYLCFYDKDSYTCQNEIELIKNLDEKKIEALEIVMIFKDNNTNYIKSLKNYDWTILHCDENDKILTDYNIAAYPTYYLIHPDGNLLLYPAPGPAENFEAAYYKVFQSWKREQLKNENK
jgi:peroxiredoxin